MSLEMLYKKTSDLTEKEIEDSLHVFNNTFGLNMGKDFFNWKYKDNIFGGSLHVIGYDGTEPVASRAFWRNDIGKTVAYQPVDTAVMPQYQGKGIFKTTSFACLELLKGAYIYNYPNNNSRPGYLKIGWKVKHRRPVCFNLKDIVAKRYLEKESINDDYVKWKFAGSPMTKYNVCKSKGGYYLLSQFKPGLYAVMGRLNDNRFVFKEINPIVLFTFDCDDMLFKVPNKHVVYLENAMYREIENDIPSYKFDVF